MEKFDNKPILTVAEAARYSGYSRGTIEHWLAIGELKCESPPSRGNGSHRFRRIRKEDLDNMLDQSYGSEYVVEQKCPQMNDEITLLPKKDRKIERRVDL
jgi:excisionase family DNA binding protein